MLRPGNAGSNTAGEHIEADETRPWPSCPGNERRQVLIRGAPSGGTHDFLALAGQPGQRLALLGRGSP